MYQIGFFLISFYILCSPCLTFRMSGWTLLKVYYLFFIYLYFIFILSKYTYDYIYIYRISSILKLLSAALIRGRL